ncbi:MAG TPA: DciA family protein [Trebonia sp.]|nr:DciA family protein [Trebonia sp.]
MPPDPERIRLATEALARARADAWTRGDRPQPTAGTRQSSSADPERTPPTPETPFSPSWSARPRREDPELLNAALGDLLSARGWQARAAIGTVFGTWPQIVGPQVAAHTTPDTFKDGELTVLADSDSWAAQLHLLTPQILDRLAAELGADTVTHLRIRGPSSRKRGNVRPR